MRNAMLVIALVLSSAVAVVAQPRPIPRNYPYPTQQDNAPDRDRYDRYDRSRWNRGDYPQRWTTLASGYTASTPRQFIPVRGLTFDRLRIEAVRGSPMIQQVAVIYTNGSTQVIRLNTRLPRGSGEVLRLNRAPVHRIVIYSNPRYRGAYTLYGGYGRGPRMGT